MARKLARRASYSQRRKGETHKHLPSLSQLGLNWLVVGRCATIERPVPVLDVLAVSGEISLTGVRITNPRPERNRRGVPRCGGQVCPAKHRRRYNWVVRSRLEPRKRKVRMQRFENTPLATSDD
jgi:hypothetical protein